MNGTKGLSAWRWLFIIEGCLTVVVAGIAVFCIPDLPRTTRWLNEEEKQLAAWRLGGDIGEGDWVSDLFGLEWSGSEGKSTPSTKITI